MIGSTVVGSTSSVAGQPAPSIGEQLFHILDRNHDGVVTRSEMSPVIMAVLQSQQGAAAALAAGSVPSILTQGNLTTIGQAPGMFVQEPVAGLMTTQSLLTSQVPRQAPGSAVPTTIGQAPGTYVVDGVGGGAPLVVTQTPEGLTTIGQAPGRYIPEAAVSGGPLMHTQPHGFAPSMGQFPQGAPPSRSQGVPTTIGQGPGTYVVDGVGGGPPLVVTQTPEGLTTIGQAPGRFVPDVAWGGSMPSQQQYGTLPMEPVGGLPMMGAQAGTTIGQGPGTYVVDSAGGGAPLMVTQTPEGLTTISQVPGRQVPDMYSQQAVYSAPPANRQFGGGGFAPRQQGVPTTIGQGPGTYVVDGVGGGPPLVVTQTPEGLTTIGQAPGRYVPDFPAYGPQGVPAQSIGTFAGRRAARQSVGHAPGSYVLDPVGGGSVPLMVTQTPEGLTTISPAAQGFAPGTFVPGAMASHAPTESRSVGRGPGSYVVDGVSGGLPLVITQTAQGVTSVGEAPANLLPGTYIPEGVGSRVPDGHDTVPQEPGSYIVEGVQGGAPLVVTQTADRRTSIARAPAGLVPGQVFQQGVEPAGVPVILGRAPGAYVVEGIDGGAPLLITQTEYGVTAIGQAPEALAPGTHIPHDIHSLGSVPQGNVAAPGSSFYGPTGIVDGENVSRVGQAPGSYVVEGPGGGAPLVVTQTADKRTSIAPAPPGYAPGTFIPEGVDVGVPVATVTHEPGSHVLQGVGGGAPLVVTQTPQGVTTIGQASPAVAVGTFVPHGAGRPVAGGGRSSMMSVPGEYWQDPTSIGQAPGSYVVEGVAGGTPLVVTQTADRRTSIARAPAGLVPGTFYPEGVDVGPAVPVQTIGHDPGSYVVEGVAGGVPLIVTQTPHGVTTIGQAPAAMQPGTFIPQSVGRPTVSRPSVVRLPAVQRDVPAFAVSSSPASVGHAPGSYVVEGPAGGAPLIVTQTADKRTSIAPAPLGYATGTFIPEGVNVGVPAATITHEPGSHVLEGVAGGAPLIITQTPQGVTTITRAPAAVPVGTFTPHGRSVPGVSSSASGTSPSVSATVGQAPGSYVVEGVAGGGPLIVTQTPDRRTSIAPAPVGYTPGTFIPGGVDMGVVPSASVDHEPGSYVVEGVGGSAPLIVTQTPHGVTTITAASPQDLGQRASVSRMPGGYSQAPSFESPERRVGGAVGSYIIEGVAGGAPLVVSQMPEGLTTIGQAPPGYAPGSYSPTVVDAVGEQASIGRAPGAYVVEGVGNGAPLLVTQTAQGETTIGPANAWDSGAPEAQNPSEVVASVGHAPGSHVVAGVPGGVPLIITQTPDNRTSIARAPAGYEPGMFIPQGLDVGVPAATISRDPGSYVVEGVGGGAPLIVTQTPQGVTTIGQAPPAVNVGTFTPHGLRGGSVVGGPGIPASVGQAPGSYIVDGVNGGAPLVVTQTPENLTTIGQAPFGLIPGAYYPEGVDAVGPTQPTIGQEPGSYVLEGLGGGAPVMVTQTPHGVTTLAPAPSTMTPGQFYPLGSAGTYGQQGQAPGMFVQEPVVGGGGGGPNYRTTGAQYVSQGSSMMRQGGQHVSPAVSMMAPVSTTPQEPYLRQSRAYQYPHQEGQSFLMHQEPPYLFESPFSGHYEETELQPPQFVQQEPKMHTVRTFQGGLPVTTLIKEIPEVQIVERIREVPEVSVVEKVVEVETKLYQEKVVEKPVVKTTELVKQIARVEVQEVEKHIMKQITQVETREVQVPQLLTVEKVVEIIVDQPVELIRQVPVTQVQEVEKQIGKPVYQFVEKFVEVPIVSTVEEIVAVPVAQIEDIIKEVPRPEIQIVERQVEKPIPEFVHRIVEVPQVTRQEVIVEYPQVEIVELVKQVAIEELQTLEKEVARPEVQYVEKIVEVPHVIYEEQVKEIPTIEIKEVIKQRLKPEVRYIDRRVPKKVIQYVEKTVEVPHIIYEERAIEVPQVISVEAVTQVPSVQLEVLPKEVPKYFFQKQERLVEKVIELTQEEPVEVVVQQVVEVIKEVAVPEMQYVDKPVPNVVFETHEQIVQVPQVFYTEELVEVPQVQMREVLKEVSNPQVRELVRQIPVIETQVMETVQMVPATLTQEVAVQVEQIMNVEVVAQKAAVEAEQRIVLTGTEYWREVERDSVVEKELQGELIGTFEAQTVSIRDIPVPADEVTTIPIGTISTTGTATEPYYAGVSLDTYQEPTYFQEPVATYHQEPVSTYPTQVYQEVPMVAPTYYQQPMPTYTTQPLPQEPVAGAYYVPPPPPQEPIVQQQQHMTMFGAAPATVPMVQTMAARPTTTYGTPTIVQQDPRLAARPQYGAPVATYTR